VQALVSVVDLSTGLVSESHPDASTVDVPPTLAPGASEAAVDGVELLHFAGPDGRASLGRTSPRPVSERRADERFFVCGGVQDRNEHGWQIYRLCAREA
jgi:hypothetical protein